MSNWNPLPTRRASNVLNGGHCKLACSWRRWCPVLSVPAATTLHGLVQSQWFSFTVYIRVYVCTYVQYAHIFCMRHQHKGVIGMNVCASVPSLFHAALSRAGCHLNWSNVSLVPIFASCMNSTHQNTTVCVLCGTYWISAYIRIMLKRNVSVWATPVGETLVTGPSMLGRSALARSTAVYCRMGLCALLITCTHDPGECECMCPIAVCTQWSPIQNVGSHGSAICRSGPQYCHESLCLWGAWHV